MVKFSEAVALPWECRGTLFMRGAMPAALTRKPFSAVLEELPWGKCYTSELKGYWGKWFMRGARPVAPAVNFPQEVQGKPFMRSTTSGPPLCCKAFWSHTYPGESHLHYRSLPGGIHQNQREKPLRLPVSLQCPLPTKLNITPAGKRSVFSSPVPLSQSKHKEGQVWSWKAINW